MMEGAEDLPAARFIGVAATGGGGGAAGALSFVLLNMTACLNESARISQGTSQPHFVVDVRPGAAAGRPESSHRRAFLNCSANPHQNR